MNNETLFPAGNIAALLKSAKLPVIIFGQGIVGKALYKRCCDWGISIECFCENNIHKTKQLFCNTKVVYEPNLRSLYGDAIFLIAIANIGIAVKKLRRMNYSNLIAGAALLKGFDLTDITCHGATPAYIEHIVSTCILYHHSYRFPDKLLLQSVDFIITERCSLKCRDCSNLMQYYKHPADINIDQLFRQIDKLCACVDEIYEARILGGEPFMNKNLSLITQRIIDEPRVNKIIIFTNGTIIPGDKQVECFKSSKVLIYITNYGLLSKKVGKLTELFAKNHIAYNINTCTSWTDCAKIKKHNRTESEQKIIFENCCAKNILTISNGKIYRCPFSANASRLRAIPNFESDCVDFMNSAITMDIIRSNIKKLMFEKEYIEACDYCNGRVYGAPEIPSAIQTKTPLFYKEFH